MGDYGRERLTEDCESNASFAPGMGRSYKFEISESGVQEVFLNASP
jgi:hypothetical protein